MSKFENELTVQVTGLGQRVIGDAHVVVGMIALVPLGQFAQVDPRPQPGRLLHRIFEY